MRVEFSAPAYHPFSLGAGALILHLHLLNTADSRVTLLSGDLLLVDGQGALFPASWSDPNGRQHDGLLEPNHTLVALDPGAQAQLDLPFAVLSSGPFSVRYEHLGRSHQIELPGPTLPSTRPGLGGIGVATD
jgi:hypothetical protein